MTAGARQLDQLTALLDRFTRKAGVRPQCEVCGQEKGWHPVVGLGSERETEQDTICLALAAGEGRPSEGRDWRVYAVACNYCGNTRLFNKAVVERIGQV
jgi:hypothetical protein